MKVADVKLSWTKSPSADVVRVQVAVNNNGEETSAEFGPEVEDFTIVVQARGVVSFKVIVVDGEDLPAISSTYTFTLGDLENPLPATNLRHEIVGIRDVPDA